MTDLVFEEPPQRTQRSEHYGLLVALKEHSGRGHARVKVGMDEKEATRLASQLRGMAAKLGDGYEVISRWDPATGKHGVWAKYDAPVQAAEGGAVQIDAEAAVAPSAPAGVPAMPTSADVLQRGVVDAAMPWDGLPDLPVGGAVPVLPSAEVSGDGTGQALPPYDGPRTAAYGDPSF